ncbi:SPOR domain-containing protein [Stenotrophomonas sp. MYb238]|uniref:SPOR domain-containing protein n=1 Tax=Stenotrophomonas sp. MYb238 TaxID=2040281 RepID=UPI0012911DFF|nr:SPOR domain-containing protein [Stenotrophomonas sp. MYb238]MQP74509.1 SPOR domain-containing protein [Stenotrophomonas sp. MYb238]
MLIRFLIVALAILNLGVALWWMVPRPTPALASEASEAGVATLELVPMDAPAATVPPPAPDVVALAPSTVASKASPETGKAVVATEPTVPSPTPERCSSFGPFDSQESAQSAVTALGADALRSHVREVPPKAATSFRVLIPPAPSREEAQAMVKRIADAGFNDYFIIAQGDDANAVALGQYRNREGAERRLAALTAAGFPARIVDNGAGAAVLWWLDAAHAGTVAATDLQKRSGAPQRQSLDCARLR